MVLSAILYYEEAIYEACEILKPEHFYDGRHRLIYKRAIDLMLEGAPVNNLAVVEKLKACGEFEKAGGYSYLAEIKAVTGTPSQIPHFGGIVQDKYLRREAINLSGEIATDCRDKGDMRAGDIVNGFVGRLLDISQIKEAAHYAVSYTHLTLPTN